MVTSSDIEFEQPQPKIFHLAKHTLALISGDISFQTEVVSETQREVAATGITLVTETTKAFAQIYARRCRESVEAGVLAPINLTSESFLRQQQALHPQLVELITRQLQTGMSERDDATVVLGVDGLGPHLAMVYGPGQYACMDTIAFVATGAGARHAESQFMFSRYTRAWSFPRALYLVYVAKRRAEVAPGVGRATDLAVITTDPPGVLHLPDGHDFLKLLKSIYDEETRLVFEARSKAIDALDRELRILLTNSGMCCQAQKEVA